MKAFTIIELLVVIAIVGVALAGLLGIATFSLNAATLVRETTQANALAQEALEAVRNFRDTVSWANNDPANQYDGLGVVALAAPYHPEIVATTPPPRWALIAGAETLGAFGRQVVFDEVRRDAANTIVPSGGAVDVNAKKVTATVTWFSGGSTKKVELVTYLTNWR